MVLFGKDTVTLFNRVYDVENEEEVWYRTKLTNVNLVRTQGRNISTSGISDADKALLVIDTSSSSKGYLSVMNFLASTSKENYFTLNPDSDFFVLGDFLTSTTLPDEDLLEYMLTHYDDVYRITTVDVYEDVLPHIEIGGK